MPTMGMTMTIRHMRATITPSTTTAPMSPVQSAMTAATAAPAMSMTTPADRGKRWYQTAKGRLVIFTALLLGAAWVIEYLAPEVGKWAFVAACLIGVAPVAQRAFAALRMGQPFTIESLMTIAAIGALFINAAEEAALVVFLFAVGEVLEGVAAGKARDGIRALANLVPKTAQLVTRRHNARGASSEPVRGPDCASASPATAFRPMARSPMAPQASMKARSPAKACPRRAGRGNPYLQARSTPRPPCGSR